MDSKRTYIATFWRGNPQLKNGGYYTTKEFQAVSHKAAERQAERYTKGMIYGSLNLISVELKQENSNESKQKLPFRIDEHSKQYVGNRRNKN